MSRPLTPPEPMNMTPIDLKAEKLDPLPEQIEVTPVDQKVETLDPIGDTVEQ